MEGTATREVYFGIQSVWIMYALLVPTAGIFCYGSYQRIRSWTAGTAAPRFDDVPKRLARVARHVLAQRKVMRDRVVGIAHALLVWSMIALFLGTAVIFVHQDLHLPIMQGNFYLYFQSILLNLAGVLGIVALVIAAAHRYVVRPSRLQRSREAQGWCDDGIALLWLIFILLQGFVLSGLRIVLSGDPYAEYRFVGNLIGQLFVVSGVSEATMAMLHQLIWWLHLVTALGWIAWLPYSKMMHALAAPLAVFFSPLTPKGALRPVPDAQHAARIGVGRLADFSWKDLLDLDACATCGRCQEVCPAHASGAPLSPKDLVLALRRFVRKGAAANGTTARLVGDSIKEETIWACTTCRACEHACPILVEHVSKIVDLRRLVLDTSGPSPALAKALEGIAVLGNPHNLPPSERASFLEELQVPILSTSSPPDVVLWLGCSSGYSPLGQEATISLVKIMRAAGVSFAILGPAEKCCGDLARRSGEEVLFLDLARYNIELMRRLGVEKLVTNCPHCFNTFRNEYPRLGATFAVTHHTELIWDLLSAGRVRVVRPFDRPMAYHDPCYLGRYNNCYDVPREILRQVTTAGLREMRRTKKTSFCCGGGGGQMYLESFPTQTRINRLRFAEAQSLAVPLLATACPSCKIMLDDAARDDSSPTKVRVKDIAELVCDAAAL